MQPAVKREDVDGAKDQVIACINAGDAEAVFAMFAPGMQQAVSQAKTRALVAAVVASKGKLLSGARIAGDDGNGLYELTAERGGLRLELHLDAEGRIDGLKLTEPPRADPPVERTTMPLRLPFRGNWTVVWGGDRLELNHHLGHASQRRAADLVMVDADGKTHAGNGERVSDYYAWGKDVLATADGEVITVVDGIPENQPGRMNEYLAAGNLVIVQHAPNVFSVYAHLQSGKTRVTVGQKLQAGAVLGLVGNSGNSSEPHLHFQIQDGADFAASFGVEAVFDNVRVTRGADTNVANGYTFLKGDVVESL